MTESRDNFVKQVIVTSGCVSLRVDLMFCEDKRLERRMAYFFPEGVGGMTVPQLYLLWIY